MSEEDSEFWLKVSQLALGKIWDNPVDDVYYELFQAKEGDNDGHGDLRAGNGH
jgi:hypothetical protein